MADLLHSYCCGVLFSAFAFPTWLIGACYPMLLRPKPPFRSFGVDYPGLVNPLDDHNQVSPEDGSHMYQYYLKIVPTRYRKINGQSINTNQYSVTTHKKAVTQKLGDTGLPGVFFMFEISPILVQMKESRRSVSTAVTVRKTTGLGFVRPLCAGCLLFCTDHFMPLRFRNNAQCQTAYSKPHRSFTHFLTGVCAIIGGIFTGNSLLLLLCT